MMRKYTPVIIFVAGLMVSPVVAVAGQGQYQGKHNGYLCDYDRKEMLALGEQDFDQDVSDGGKGWREISKIPGCDGAAADLIKIYRKQHKLKSTILLWHEGQLRANAGQTAMAIELMNQARKSLSEDIAGWNYYVDATIAFLRKDRPSLLDARNKLSAVPPSADLPPLKEGYINLELGNGQMAKISWPPNLDVVNGLVRCFDKSYKIAYGPSCR